MRRGQFSKRYGYREPQLELTIREDAPEPVRAFVLSTLDSSFGDENARSLVCATLRKLPNSRHWISCNVWREVQLIVESCEWFQVYDLLEAIYRSFPAKRGVRIGQPAAEFAQELNELLEDYGIGWKLEGGKITSLRVGRPEPWRGRSTPSTTTAYLRHPIGRQLNRRPSATSHQCKLREILLVIR